MSRHTRATALGCRWALTSWLMLVNATAGVHATPLDADLSAALAQGLSGNVSVLVALAPDEASRHANDVSQRIAAVQIAGDRVLDALPNGSYRVERRWQAVAGMLLDIDSSALATLAALPEVRRVGIEMGPGRGNLAESVPLVGLKTLRESLGYSGTGSRIAVLDSGVDSDHPDIAETLIGQRCFAEGGLACPEGPSPAEDDVGHGTGVTAVVAGAGIVAPTGGAPAAKVFAVKVLDSNNSFSTTVFVVDGLDFIITSGIEFDAVNMSLGTFATFPGDCDDDYTFTMILADAINTLHARGTLSVVSSGNQGNHVGMQAPACIANAISVGATHDGGPQLGGNCTSDSQIQDDATCYSNASDTTDLFAPGSEIETATLDGESALWHGTSFAAPLVSACIATLRDIDPGLPPDEVEDVLTQSGTVTVDVGGRRYPRLDCLAAANRVLANVDHDGDGVPDIADNCPQIANGAQTDADNDGIGNRCDPDLNNDCVVNAVDLGLLRSALFGADPVADFNSDGAVNSVDLGILKAFFFTRPGPGRPGNLCAGPVAVPVLR